MTPLRLAVIGVGHLGRIHARIAAGLEEIDLVAVVDADEAARDAVADSTGAQALADYHEIVGQVDAAIIATPTKTHHVIGIDLLQSGIPVFMEKPLAATAAEAEALTALAEVKGLALQVGHVERFNPALASVRDELSEPKYIEAIRTSNYTFRSTDIGVVMDIMIHDIDVVLSLVDTEVVRVEALGISILGGHEDMASARLTFAGGCVAQLTASRVNFAQQRVMRVFTPRRFASLDFAARRATVVRPEDTILLRAFDVSQLTPKARDYWKDHLFDELLVTSQPEAEEVNAIEVEQRDFVESVRSGKKPIVDGAAGRDAVALAERILECIAAHEWDGSAVGRKGALAMPDPPILNSPTFWQPENERRRAG